MSDTPEFGTHGFPVPPKKRRRGLIIALVAGGAALFFLLVCGGLGAVFTAAATSTPKVAATAAPVSTDLPAPTDAPTSAAASTPVFALGEPAGVTSSDGVAGDMRATVTVTSARVMTSPNEFLTAKGQFLVADVAIAVQTGSYDANPFDFAAQAPDGAYYQAEMNPFEPALDATTLQAGNHTHGYVAFDVPVGSIHGYRIVLRSGLSDDIGYWTIP